MPGAAILSLIVLLFHHPGDSTEGFRLNDREYFGTCGANVLVFSNSYDDRWAFTSGSSALNYGTAAALAAGYLYLVHAADDLVSEALPGAHH